MIKRCEEEFQLAAVAISQSPDVLEMRYLGNRDRMAMA